MTASKSALFATLQARRAAAGKAPLASWKQSLAKLQAAVDALPAVETVSKPKRQRFFTKGVFKSKRPVMEDARGKVWTHVEVLLSDGRFVPASFESKGTYFYFDLDDVCYSSRRDAQVVRESLAHGTYFDLSVKA